MSSRDQLPSDEKPPLFSRWWMWYVLVVAWLVGVDWIVSMVYPFIFLS